MYQILTFDTVLFEAEFNPTFLEVLRNTQAFMISVLLASAIEYKIMD